MLNPAETEGFEPSRAVKPCLVSSEVLSTTQPRLLLHIYDTPSGIQFLRDGLECSNKFVLLAPSRKLLKALPGKPGPDEKQSSLLFIHSATSLYMLRYQIF